VPGAVIGGLDQWSTLQDASPEAALAQIQTRSPRRRSRIFLGAAAANPPHLGRDLVRIAKDPGRGAEARLPPAAVAMTSCVPAALAVAVLLGASAVAAPRRPPTW